MNQQLGAHETMEIHEVLTDCINGINQFELYQPHVQDPRLRNILDNQIRHMTQEYNNLVSLMSGRGIQSPAPKQNVRAQGFTPTYGVQTAIPAQSPNRTAKTLNDQDIAIGMLSCHKSSATMKMTASLEFADPVLRRHVMQAANSSAEQAYEIFQYMNQNGYYQVPTMNPQTAQAVMNQYQPAATTTYQPSQMHQ